MSLIILIVLHVVLCLVAFSDLASLAMPVRARYAWLAIVILVPVLGVAVYAFYGRQQWGGGREGWFDLRGHDGPGPVHGGARDPPANRVKGGPGGAAS